MKYSQQIIALAELSLMVILMFVTLAGWGRLAKKTFGLPRTPFLSTLEVWFGLVALIAIVEFLHLFFPIDWRMASILALVGIAVLLFAERIEWKQSFKSLGTVARKYPWATAAVATLYAVLCLNAMNSPESYDAGLYHFANIRWLNEYSIVPGLGNLHGRLAFNQSYFGYIALLNVAPYWNKGYAIAGLFMVLLSLATLLQARLVQVRGGLWLFYTLVIAILFYSQDISAPATLNPVAAPTPDLAVALLQVVLVLLLLKVILSKPSSTLHHTEHAALLVLLCITITTIKLSAAIYAFVCICVALPLVYTHFLANVRLTVTLMILGMVIMVVHILRGILLSGAPLYPSTVAANWNLDWAIPFEMVKSQNMWIYSWARRPGLPPEQVLGNWDWVIPWLNALPIRAYLLFGSAAILFALNVLFDFNGKAKLQGPERLCYLLFLPFVASTAFWFATAPDLRFIGLIPELMTVFSAWLLVRRFQQLGAGFAKSPKYRTLLHAVLPAAIVAYVIYSISPVPREWGTIPSVPTEVKTSYSGLRVNVPLAGDQCWDEPLPCSPYFSEQLRLRKGLGSTDLSSGFSLKNPVEEPAENHPGTPPHR